MPGDDLGAPLTDFYTIPGGSARLFERGCSVQVADETITAWFLLPLVGRPTILTGAPSGAAPFAPHAIHFAQGVLPLEQAAAAVTSALAGRLALVATGQPTASLPLSVGQPAELTAAQATLRGRSHVWWGQPPAQHEPGLPAVIDVPLTIDGTPLERQLYDVAVLGDAVDWHVIAPHALYHRQQWTDFGIAHITDMHVARRIDSFRGLLAGLGRQEAADKMYNWNDRFRGFVKYANYLHRIGALDVILATGDLYDYIFEDDDDPAGGGNPEFLRQLILGQAPGPEFTDVEELNVPIFVVPGNHDYRKHAYKLIFDVSVDLVIVGTTIKRVSNFFGYHMLEDDAIALAKELAHSAPLPPIFEILSDGVQAVSIGEAARMVEVDTRNLPYKTFVADRGSYVVQLGSHRIAMIDSAWDVGTVTDAWDGLSVYFGTSSEDENTFVGGSPNCEGVSAEELAMVAAALDETPEDGLLIVGLHAPLFNMWNAEYPYFLRETQRAEQANQTYGFLARQDGRPLLPNEVEEQIKDRHPLWFPAERDSRAPRFVKRADSQDLLDYGVSRGHAEQLMALLAGVGSRRPADALLAGHTHRHNEFTVRQTPTGELTYSMDFYTENPVQAYPTRFTTSWKAVPASGMWVQAPVTEVTYVNVVPGAPPNAQPSAMGGEAMYKYAVQVPPYPNPLATAPDPRAWWAEHRPLVLQTGALGPLDNSQVSFSGFRVLSVKDNVISKVHFISTRQLELSDYKLAWEWQLGPGGGQPIGQVPSAPSGVLE